MAFETVAIGSAALGAATSAAAAHAQNQALQSAASSQGRAAQVQSNQVATRGLLERDENRRIADQIEARSRVLALARGGSISDTDADIDRTITIDAGRNAAISRDNQSSQLDFIRSGYQSNLATLRAQSRSAILDTVVGGLYGLSTGLSIGGAGRDAGWIS